jgi:hypothetical protein
MNFQLGPIEGAKECLWFLFWMVVFIVFIIKRDIRNEQNEKDFR